MNLLEISLATLELAGVSVLVVFAILIALVGILSIFTAVAKKTKVHVKEKKAASEAQKQVKAFEEASEQDRAAVAVALYLYYNDDHDHESGVLTLNQTPSAWGPTLNPRF